MTDYRKVFSKAADSESIRLNEPMKNHTTFKTGGNADCMLLPASGESLKELIEIADKNNIPVTLIGNGSNLLVGDKGIRGAVIKLGKEFSQIDLEGNTIYACAGALLSTVAQTAYRAGLKGMEFAAGIPGSLGGGVCMNAGAYGGELKDIIVSVDVLRDGEIVTLTNEECAFGYRTSRILREKMVVLGAKITLEQGNKEEIKAVMDDLAFRRRDKQPLDKPSAGSTFKRPEGDFAGRLIEASGLRGYSLGGAQVSEKHCGFVVNKGNATSKDILDLIEYVKNKVYEDSGVMLEPEVRILGEF